MFEKINWKDVKVNNVYKYEYKYEEKYYLQLKVHVLEKEIINDKFHNDYYRYKLLILKIYNGTIADQYGVGDILIVGKSLSEGRYLTYGKQFKPIDGNFEYCFNPTK